MLSDSEQKLDENVDKKERKKKTVPRIRAEILMSEKGLKSLLADFNSSGIFDLTSKKLRVESLMRLFKRWIEEMDPKIDFEDAMDDIFLLGKSREITNYVRNLKRDFFDENAKQHNLDSEDFDFLKESVAANKEDFAEKSRMNIKLPNAENTEKDEKMENFSNQRDSTETIASPNKKIIDEKVEPQTEISPANNKKSENIEKENSENTESAMDNIGLTETQKQRIKRNRERALEIRKLKRPCK
ncbi:hypothetical protein MHBO_000906 [Bonamia ostreae]|uniref:Chromosome segregation in meiosis protein 3 domain-containing protein n=2 Tax=Bonamia ostreae TaxID=126728 RepID=A0ABV2AI26_9EUKA